MMCSQRPSRASRGFSLMEVVLAVALSAVIVYLVAGAIDFHLRQLTVRRTNIEQAQIARAVLRQIADDLRATVIDRPIDFSSVSDLADGAAMLSDLSSGEEDSDDPSGDGSGAGSDTSTATMEEATDDLIASSQLPSTPGIYGNQYELQIDVGRLPRFEEYSALSQFADPTQLQMISDVKSVTYFVTGGQFGGSMMNGSMMNGAMTNGSMMNSFASQSNSLQTLGMGDQQYSSGLVRQSIDRAVARLSGAYGDMANMSQQVDLLAPEVMMIEFRYFDGQQWLYEWDTESLGGIPLAVEITLVLARPNDQDTNGYLSPTNINLMDYDPNYVYRLVVSLPHAEIIETEEETTEEDASEVSP